MMLSLSRFGLSEKLTCSSSAFTTAFSQLLRCQSAKSACLPLACAGQNKSHQTAVQTTQRRFYSDGEYEKLWSAATGGRGVGRGRKKKRSIPVDEQFSKFGKEKKFWPGFTSPIDLTSPKPADSDNRNLDNEKPRDGYIRHQRPFEKGWSGHKWPGKSAGAPILPNGDVLDDFNSVVVELKRVAVQKARGKKRQISAAVVIGNRNGVVGWAIGKGQIPVGAIRKARNKAANYLHDINISDNHTIYHDLKLKYDNIRMTMERKPKGHGLRCQRIVRTICDLAGIKDLRCKLIGGSTPQTIVNATIAALKSQETHKELAERKGKNVVEFRAEDGMRPVVVASPSESSIRARIERETDIDPNSNIESAFDPTRGLHKTKSISHGRGRHVPI